MGEKQYRLQSINDLLQFDQEQLLRLLPDLISWHKVMRDVVSYGAEPVGMMWVDDGKPGQVHSVEIRVKETGQVLTVKGEAWSEPEND